MPDSVAITDSDLEPSQPSAKEPVFQQVPYGSTLQGVLNTLMAVCFILKLEDRPVPGIGSMEPLLPENFHLHSLCKSFLYEDWEQIVKSLIPPENLKVCFPFESGVNGRWSLPILDAPVIQINKNTIEEVENIRFPFHTQV